MRFPKDNATFLTKRSIENIIKSLFALQTADRESNTRGCYLPEFIRRQVMYMNGYEITMICIASMTLLLKLIEFILNQIKK